MIPIPLGIHLAFPKHNPSKQLNSPSMQSNKDFLALNHTINNHKEREKRAQKGQISLKSKPPTT